MNILNILMKKVSLVVEGCVSKSTKNRTSNSEILSNRTVYKVNEGKWIPQSLQNDSISIQQFNHLMKTPVFFLYHIYGHKKTLYQYFPASCSLLMQMQYSLYNSSSSEWKIMSVSIWTFTRWLLMSVWPWSTPPTMRTRMHLCAFNMCVLCLCTSFCVTQGQNSGKPCHGGASWVCVCLMTLIYI